MVKIMLVEDDQNLSEIYEARLQAEGYTIVSAKDGEDALVVAKKEHPDLIISDVMMPKISGFEMLDILRNTDKLKDVKIIMLTALGQADDKSRASKLGADRYLVKSQVTLEDIVKAAKELLGDTTGDSSGATSAADAIPASTSNTDPALAAPAPQPPSDTAQPATPPSAPTVAAPAETASPKPITVQSPPDNADDGSSTPLTPQSANDEASQVNGQINDFVNKDGTVQTDGDKIMQNAVDNLVASTEKPEPEAKAPSEVADSSAPAAASHPDAQKGGSVTIANKKIIQPLKSDPQPDLNQLAAMEEAKETAAKNNILEPKSSPSAQPGNHNPGQLPNSSSDPGSIAL